MRGILSNRENKGGAAIGPPYSFQCYITCGGINGGRATPIFIFAPYLENSGYSEFLTRYDWLPTPTGGVWASNATPSNYLNRLQRFALKSNSATTGTNTLFSQNLDYGGLLNKLYFEKLLLTKIEIAAYDTTMDVRGQTPANSSLDFSLLPNTVGIIGFENGDLIKNVEGIPQYIDPKDINTVNNFVKIPCNIVLDGSTGIVFEYLRGTKALVSGIVLNVNMTLQNYK